MVAHESIAAPSTNGDITTQLPKMVQINGNPSFSPNELRVLKAMTGRTLESIMGDEVDAIQAMVWLALRDEGFTSVTWEQCGDVRGEMVTPTPDPFTSGDSMTSLPSAAFGAALPATSTSSPTTSTEPSSGS